MILIVWGQSENVFFITKNSNHILFYWANGIVVWFCFINILAIWYCQWNLTIWHMKILCISGSVGFWARNQTYHVFYIRKLWMISILRKPVLTINHFLRITYGCILVIFFLLAIDKDVENNILKIIATFSSGPMSQLTVVYFHLVNISHIKLAKY